MTEIITDRQVKKQYASPHALHILETREYLEAVPKTKRREHQKYKVMRPLPTVEEMRTVIHAKFTTTADSLVDDAVGELQCLGEELREWYDNLPESLQQSDKAYTLDESAGMLEAVYEPDLDDSATEVDVVFIPAINISSRRDRHAEAIAMLEAAKEALITADEGLDGELDLTKDNTHEEGVNDIENIIHEVECVEFPGMFG